MYAGIAKAQCRKWLKMKRKWARMILAKKKTIKKHVLTNNSCSQCAPAIMLGVQSPNMHLWSPDTHCTNLIGLTRFCKQIDLQTFGVGFKPVVHFNDTFWKNATHTQNYTTSAISSNMKSKSTTIHYLASNLSLADISCFQIFHLLYKPTISLISVQYVKKELVLRTRSFWTHIERWFVQYLWHIAQRHSKHTCTRTYRCRPWVSSWVHPVQWRVPDKNHLSRALDSSWLTSLLLFTCFCSQEESLLQHTTTTRTQDTVCKNTTMFYALIKYCIFWTKMAHEAFGLRQHIISFAWSIQHVAQPFAIACCIEMSTFCNWLSGASFHAWGGFWLNPAKLLRVENLSLSCHFLLFRELRTTSPLHPIALAQKSQWLKVGTLWIRY